MDDSILSQSAELMETLGLDEEPMGLYYTDDPPEKAFSPKPMETPTREREMENAIDWQAVFGQFSCVIGNIWLARKKKRAAVFSHTMFGCPGGAFWLGFLKPQTETIVHYVSTGVPGAMEGELYCSSPGAIRDIFEYVDPRPAPADYCVVKPLSHFEGDEVPELVIFFARPESLSGLHQLATFVTNDPEVVASPFSAGCGGIAAWPLHYLQKDQFRAVVSGWDPSARKFYKPDELSFTVPWRMFLDMAGRWDESFLTTDTWKGVRRKIAKSRRTWGEDPEE
ncbi:MAG: DUF169 domain-containing protein [Desulfatibacillaceae bacterium]